MMAVLQQRVDLDAVTRGWAGMQAPPAAAAVTPFENITDATAASAATKDEWFRTGYRSILVFYDMLLYLILIYAPRVQIP